MAIPKSIIQNKVLLPDGSAPTSGYLVAKLSQPGSALDGSTSQRVGAADRAILGADGSLPTGWGLCPNDAIVPSGTYYSVEFHLKDDKGIPYNWTEKWQLASSPSPIDIGSVPRLGVVPGVAVAADLASNQAQANAAAASAASASASAASAAAGAATATNVPKVYTDTPGATAGMLRIEHYALGPGQFYAIDVHNYPDNQTTPTDGVGAQTAIVVHHYSDSSPGVQFDNVRSQPLLRLRNASNATIAPGKYGTGMFIDVWGYSANAVYPASPVILAALDQFLVWRSYDNSRPITFASQTTADALRVTMGNAGNALRITQTGAGPSLYVDHQGAAHGVQIVPAAGSDGFYPLIIQGRRFAASFSTSLDNASYFALGLTKGGTGAGDALFIVNKGTGYGMRVQNASADVYRLDNAGMPQIGIGNTAAPPAASSSYAGKFWYQGGAAGVKDNVYVCAKDAADAWSWRALY